MHIHTEVHRKCNITRGVMSATQLTTELQMGNTGKCFPNGVTPTFALLSLISTTHYSISNQCQCLLWSDFSNMSFCCCSPIGPTELEKNPSVHPLKLKLIATAFTGISLDRLCNVIQWRGFYFLKHLHLHNKQRKGTGCYEVLYIQV